VDLSVLPSFTGNNMCILIKFSLAAMLCILLTIGPSTAGPESQELRIDAASSKMVVHVGRSGLFGFAGHDHEVVVPVLAGSVMLDRTDVSRSKVSVQFDATAMKVTGKGEPREDVPEVQRVMLSERVLDVERHPKIAFVSEDISVVQRSAGRMRLRINGQLTLRGVARRVTVPTEVELTADRLTAAGKATVRQTNFGIRPVTAGAGTVKVKDEVEIVFTIVAGTAN
jgi:polyisoprenoid-binding protein YceI